MSKRAAVVFAKPPLAPPLRPGPESIQPTERFSNRRAFVEATRPDTMLRAIVPNDAIDLIAQRMHAPLLMAVSTHSTRVFDTGSAAQQWSIPDIVGIGDRHISSTVLHGTAFVLDAVTRHDDDENMALLHRFNEANGRWDRVCMLSTPCCALASAASALFVCQSSDGSRLMRIVENQPNVQCSRPAEQDHAWFASNVCSGRDKIHVTGGVGVHVRDSVCAYDPHSDTWADLPPMMFPRVYHGSTASKDGDTLFVIGGGQEGSGRYIAAAERCDLRELKWHGIASYPAEVMRCAAHALDDTQIVATGGYHANYSSSLVHVYDSRADRWTVEPKWQLPLYLDMTGLLVL